MSAKQSYDWKALPDLEVSPRHFPSAPEKIDAVAGLLKQRVYLDWNDAGTVRAAEFSAAGSFKGAVYLKGLIDLQRLDLSETQITDVELQCIAGLNNLWSLRLANTQVTDAGLLHLKGLTNLWSLDLFNTQVTDAGLLHLKGLANLARLNLKKTQVTPPGVAGLQRALPNCQIRY